MELYCCEYSYGHYVRICAQSYCNRVSGQCSVGLRASDNQIGEIMNLMLSRLPEFLKKLTHGGIIVMGFRLRLSSGAGSLS